MLTTRIPNMEIGNTMVLSSNLAIKEANRAVDSGFWGNEGRLNLTFFFQTEHVQGNKTGEAHPVEDMASNIKL